MILDRSVNLIRKVVAKVFATLQLSPSELTEAEGKGGYYLIHWYDQMVACLDWTAVPIFAS